MELQEELSDKENTIFELQQGSDESDDEQIEEQASDELESYSEESQNIDNEETVLIELMVNYIKAIEGKDFDEQKRYVSKYALDLVNFKEEESKKSYSLKDRKIIKQTPTIQKIEDNSAEGFMSFTEHLTYHDNTEYKLVTEGKVYFEKQDGEWKIVDYTRKNHLISEALYLFNDIEETKNIYIDIKIQRALFSLHDKYVVVWLMLSNNSDELINMALFNSLVIGPDNIQNSSVYYDDILLEIYPNASAIGQVEYGWSNDSIGDFTLYTGYGYDKDGYV